MRSTRKMSFRNRPAGSNKSVKNNSLWRIGALASAVALLGSLASDPAYALALGRITVQSALGEALRAEIDVPEISADEAASLRVSVASPQAFKAAGLEYGAAVVGLQVSLQKRPDGRSYLRLSNSRPVAEPFVDLIVEASWASGRVVRDYAMLFDPPSLRQAAAPVAPTAAAVSRPAAQPPAPGVSSAPGNAAPPPPAQAVVRPTPARAQAQPVTPKTTSSGQQVTVKSGDTAGKLAAQNKPANISLDQMLVALLRSNPDAFIGGNINRMRSGVVLGIPTAEEAGSTSQAEASGTIVAQAKSFNAFRQKLASNIPSAQVEGASRQSTGKVQAKVEDRAAVAATPDKLTLSKGALQSQAAAEDKIAKERQSREASTRVAELSKNIGDLNRIAATPAAPVTPAAPATSVGPAVPAAAASAAKGPGLVAEKPASVSGIPLPAATLPGTPASATKSVTPTVASTVSTTPLLVPAPTQASSTTNTVAAGTTTATATAIATGVVGATPTAASVASTVVAATQAAAVSPEAASGTATPAASAAAPIIVQKPAVAALPPPESSLIDKLTDNPLVLPGLAALLALLAGFAFYRFNKRNTAASVDSSFLESRLQPDSFFGASGGQRIDTSEAGSASGSSLVYSPSQLDAAGDVDPVAEADVYLAYGRDLQAEEILKEALRTNPSRVAIHAKLMEIYAKRRDLKGFEVIAAEAFSLTGGNGPEWAYICEMGRGLDPANPMFKAGGQPTLAAARMPAQTPAMIASYGADTMRDLDPVNPMFQANGQPTLATARTPAQTPAMIASYGADTIPTPDFDLSEPGKGPVDFDLDLDFSLPDEPIQPKPLATQEAPTNSLKALGLDKSNDPTTAMPARQEPSFDALDMDFGNDTVGMSRQLDGSAENGISFTVDDAPFITKPSPAVAKAIAPAQADNGMLEFDLGSLSLDLDGPATNSAALTALAPEPALLDPLETKFALAEEFRSLGDNDGARDLANEVIARAQGALKVKAQAFLNALT